MILIRLVLLPFKIALGLVGATFRAGLAVGKAPLKASRFAVKVVGFRGWLLFILGVALGLLFAPGPGRELRAKLQAMLERGGTSDDELRVKVTFELAHAPRTWHLEQPRVSVSAGRVQLSGEVGADDERDELGRVAAAIPGVAGVDNLIEVQSGPASSSSSGSSATSGSSASSTPVD